MPPPQSDDRNTSGIIDRSLQAQLGRQLRSIFQDVADEPVPQRFIDLLESLDAREKRERDKAPNGDANKDMLGCGQGVEDEEKDL
jgi:hypothetical protein